MTAAATILICGAATLAGIVIAGWQLEQLDESRIDDLELEACDHAHTLYIGDVLVDVNAGNRWLDAWAPVERCLSCDAELVGTPRYRV